MLHQTSSLRAPFSRSTILSLVLVTLCIFVVQNRYTIHSSPVKVNYDYYSTIRSIEIRFKPQEPLFSQDIILVSFSKQLQQSHQNLAYTLIKSESEEVLMTGQATAISDAQMTTYDFDQYKAGSSSSYAVELSSAIYSQQNNSISTQPWQVVSGEWLTLELQVSQDITHTFAELYAWVNIAILSSLDPSHILYGSVNGREYFQFEVLGVTSFSQALFTMQIQNGVYGSANEALSTDPSDSYPVYLEMVPSVDFTTDFIMNIQFTTFTTGGFSTPAPATAEYPFLFFGSCEFICSSAVECLVPQYCEVSDNGLKIRIPSMVSSKTYVLKFYMVNPDYVSSRNILAWVDDVGTAKDAANIVSQVQVSPIIITSDPMHLLWGIPEAELSPAPYELGVFIDGGLNNIQVGFTIDKFCPIGLTLKVIIHVGSSEIVLSSVTHNLPDQNGSAIWTEYVSPNLILHQVSALTRINTRYWVGFRTKYTAGDDTTSLGSVEIRLESDLTNSLTLFQPYVDTVPSHTINSVSLLDTAGFHQAGTFKNIDTVVVGAEDNGLENATGTAVHSYLNNLTSVGIDPSIQNQQLMFLMKADASVFSSGGATNNFVTKIFHNPNIFESTSQKGLEVVAYDATTSTWEASANDCYIDQDPTNFTRQIYMCQKYNDHVHNSQIDNRLDTSKPTLPFYEFICGQGTNVQCMGVSCATECELFKGYSLSQGMAGVASMRNVTFNSGYQSSYLANDQVLDFVVAFYEGGALVSASLINAYTVEFTNLQNTKVEFVNTYHDGANYNEGEFVPTVLKVSGELTVQEFTSMESPSVIKIYTPPNTIEIEAFREGVNQIGCSVDCSFNKTFYLNGKTTESWIEMTSISLSNLPTLTNDFELLIPLQLTSAVDCIYIAFQANGTLQKVYRYGGSAINETLSGATTQLFVTSVYASTWDRVSDWLMDPTKSYDQSINVEQTNSDSLFSEISMGTSELTLHSDPYVSFVISQMQFLVDSTTVTVGNTITNRSCSKLAYHYLSESRQLILCQLYTNDNSTNNNIRIDYPLYHQFMGSDFPFSEIFSYGYASETTGMLEAFRMHSTAKATRGSCTVNKQTEYNNGQLGRQNEVIKFQIDPIPMALNPTGSTYRDIQITLELPNLILPTSCRIQETIFGDEYSCSVLGSSANVTTMQITITSAVLSETKLIEFLLEIYAIETGSVVLASGQVFIAQVILPHSNLVPPEVYGFSFAPYSSIAFECQNSFTYSDDGYDGTITINSSDLQAVAPNINAELSVNISLSKEKSNLLAETNVVLDFTGFTVQASTFCYFRGFQHQFELSYFTAIKYVLQTKVDIEGFTDGLQFLHCSGILVSAASTTISVTVFDTLASGNIMTTATPASIINPISTMSFSMAPISGTVSSPKFADTLGFESEYTLPLVFSEVGLVQGYIDLSDYPTLDTRISQCSSVPPSTMLCLSYKYDQLVPFNTRTNVLYFRSYYATAFTSIDLSLYPILQSHLSSKTINVFVSADSTRHYTFQLTDAVPSQITQEMIIISDYSVSSSQSLAATQHSLTVELTMPVGVTSPLVLELSEHWIMHDKSDIVPTCTLDSSTPLTCAFVKKDLLEISGHSYSISTLYSLRIDFFHSNYLIELVDPDRLSIRISVVDSTSKVADPTSYILAHDLKSQETLSALQLQDTVSNLTYLEWSNSLQFPIVYIGYYKSYLNFTVKGSQKLIEDLNFTSTDYPSDVFSCSMGYESCQFELVAPSTLTTQQAAVQLAFQHGSGNYHQLPAIWLEVSSEVCTITPSSTYDIYQNGVTIPILLNFSHCQPLQNVTVTYSFNSTEVYLDTSLSRITVTKDEPYAVLRVRHSSVSATLVNYTMTVSLTGTYASSFSISSNVIIRMINQVEAAPQAKTPQILGLQAESVHLQVQCNEPSTLFWTMGYYPETLGVEAQDIETRLLQSTDGLASSVRDELLYGELTYGLNWVSRANVWKELNISALTGSKTYSFKYFCQNLLGMTSGGKILTFTTNSSDYKLIKATLGFSAAPTYENMNNYACAIAESLVIPYADVVNSVGGNCQNFSFVFYPLLASSAYDQVLTNSSNGLPYYYLNFYVDTKILNATVIKSTLRSLLMQNSRVTSAQVPYWSIYKIEELVSFTEPTIPSDPTFTITQTSITADFPSLSQNSYLIVGLISMSYDPTTMALPTHYMIKEGQFSDTLSFDRVHMNFTKAALTHEFVGLSESSPYSVFYFVTVDDPRINAQHSDIFYSNLQTVGYVTINKWEQFLTVQALVLVGILLSLH